MLLQAAYSDFQIGAFENFNQLVEDTLVILGSGLKVFLKYPLRFANGLKSQLLIGHRFFPMRNTPVPRLQKKARKSGRLWGGRDQFLFQCRAFLFQCRAIPLPAGGEVDRIRGCSLEGDPTSIPASPHSTDGRANITPLRLVRRELSAEIVDECCDLLVIKAVSERRHVAEVVRGGRCNAVQDHLD